MIGLMTHTLLMILLCAGPPADTPTASVVTRHRLILESPGGPLPVVLEVHRGGGATRGFVINGNERAELDVAEYETKRIALRFDHYDAVVEATWDEAAGAFTGHWKKRTGADKWAQLPVRIEPASQHPPRFIPVVDRSALGGKTVAGKWRVKFDESEEPAVGVFEQSDDGSVTGTFLTTTGDYRFLAGDFDGKRLRLSSFDGAHAFLFVATMNDLSQLTGDFWSRDVWHETWSAKRDDTAALPDAMGQTKSADRIDLKAAQFPDLSGEMRSLADRRFAGKVRIIEIFGSWCPNCHDASRYLAELNSRYRNRGLSIVGLAFEVTGDFERDAKQVRRYAQRCGVNYPLLIAGVNEKSEAAKAVPWLEQIRAYPTTIFVDAEGNIRAVHTGFSGPATGDEYQKLQTEFESLIESMLDDSANRSAP